MTFTELLKLDDDAFTLTELELDVVPENDVILQPISSKALKSAAAEGGCLSGLWDLYSKRRALVTFRCLRDSRGRRLYSQPSGPPITVARGERLRGSIAVLAPRGVELDLSKLVSCDGSVNVGPGMLRYTVTSARLLRPSQLSVGLGREGGLVRLDFVTPTAIPVKVMAPPWASDMTRRVPNLYRLLPEPAYLAAYAAKALLSAVGDPKGVQLAHYYVGRLADLYMVEVDYNLRTATVVVGRDYLGRLRLLRGFTGWALYKVKRGLGSALLDRLLAVAAEIGVGKLRSMGMGELRVSVSSPGQA